MIGKRRAAAAGLPLLLGIALLAGGTVRGSWCEVVFKAVAEEADSVVLARYEKERNDEPVVHVVESILGTAPEHRLSIVAQVLEPRRPRNGDLFVLALTEDGRPLLFLDGMGACDATAILPLRKGRLPSRLRSAYDGGSGALSLDELREDLLAGGGDEAGGINQPSSIDEPLESAPGSTSR